ncbi:hypothetical protein CSB09_00540 [Candidatus Gracilibacteria bacterium]|nr:MAG: hypothetical protein CSB09_00540 [Candidatus Gracilibacteria bacterium]
MTDSFHFFCSCHPELVSGSLASFFPSEFLTYRNDNPLVLLRFFFTSSHFFDSMQTTNLHHHIMTFGTFDLFHPGHVYYLTEAQKLGKNMTIVVARDHRVIQKKGKKPFYDEVRRQKNVSEVFRDARVILGNENDILEPIREYMPDMLVFGYDQMVPLDAIKKEFPNIAITRIDGFQTQKWKTSLLRKEYEE